MAPFLKEAIPNDAPYIEPFLGGGSVYFAVAPPQALLADSNTALIETYRAIRNKAHQVIQHLSSWINDERTYYEVRNRTYNDPSQSAAQFIYLNKTCWNGLHRVNQRGQFNVPYGGRPSRPTHDPMGLLAASELLSEASLESGDFSLALEAATPDHYVYLDPPYATRASTGGFLRYNPVLFSWEDQKRLAQAAVRGAKLGATVLISNANCPEIIELYAETFRPIVLARQQLLAADPKNRVQLTEILLVSSEHLYEELSESGLSP